MAQNNICRTPNCDRIQLPNGKGYCSACYNRYLEQTQVDQNSQIINLLTHLNTNISTLAVKINNIEIKQTVIENNSNKQINKINEIENKIEEIFIPTIETNTNTKNITTNKKVHTKKNLTAVAEMLEKLK